MSRVSISRSLLLVLILLLTAAATAQSARIRVDGRFADWQSLTPLYSDAIGDPAGGPLDFGRLWVANDEMLLHLSLEVGGDMLLQQVNRIVLYLDTDNDAATGTPVNGIGAELEWRFGDREGRFNTAGGSTTISQNQIGIVTAPTVTGSRFEIALNRAAQPLPGQPLFSGDTIRIAFVDNGPGQDALPQQGERVAYAFDPTPLPPLAAPSLRRAAGSDVRFLSWNVLSDGPFDAGRAPAFRRLLTAIAPDIIGFQEIYSRGAGETEQWVEAVLGGSDWYSAKAGPDNIAVSRYPITNAWAVEGNGAFLIDLRPMIDGDLLFLVAHPPCCENDAGRQFEIDALMAFIRDAREPGGVLDLPANSPIVICGDMNLVGDAQQLTTLLTGDIVDEGRFGPDFAPDWDGSAFADLDPNTSALPLTFTWYSAGSSFSPGKLDYLIYSDSVIDSLHALALFTPTLPTDTLARYGLLADDVTRASDHLPVIGDMRFRPLTGTGTHGNSNAGGFVLEQNYPNPFNPSTRVEFGVRNAGWVNLTVYDLAGRKVATLVDEPMGTGRHSVEWSGRNGAGNAVASGVYLYRMTTGAFVQTRKMLLIR